MLTERRQTRHNSLTRRPSLRQIVGASLLPNPTNGSWWIVQIFSTNGPFSSLRRATRASVQSRAS